jgi:hypothetical protein
MLEYEGVILTEGILSKVFNKFKAWLKGLWAQIKTWLSKSVKNVLDFFGLEPVLNIGSVVF